MENYFEDLVLLGFGALSSNICFVSGLGSDPEESEVFLSSYLVGCLSQKVREIRPHGSSHAGENHRGLCEIFCERGLGGPARPRPIPMELLPQLPASRSAWNAGGPINPRAAISAGCWFLCSSEFGVFDGRRCPYGHLAPPSFEK